VSDQTEELLLDIERAYFPLPALAARVAAAEQSLQMLWTTIGFAAPATTTFSGNVYGCITGISGVVVTLYNHATGLPLTSVTSGAGGAFSGSLALTGSLSVDFSAGDAANHLDAATTNETLTAGFLTSGVNIGLTAASGYICAYGCNYPVNKTLTVADANFGSYTATYAGTFAGQLTWQTSGVTVDYTGDSTVPCAAVSNLPVTYTLTNGGSWASKATYTGTSLFNTCPGLPGGGGSASNSAHTLASVACPPSFSIDFTNAAAQRLYSHAAAGTYTITWSG
jgi:hypothetical protein